MSQGEHSKTHKRSRSRSHREYSPERKYKREESYRYERERSARAQRDNRRSHYSDHHGSRTHSRTNTYEEREYKSYKRSERSRPKDLDNRKEDRNGQPDRRVHNTKQLASSNAPSGTHMMHKKRDISSSTQKQEEASQKITLPSPTEKNAAEEYLESLSVQLNEKKDPQALIEERRRKRRELIESLDVEEESTHEIVSSEAPMEESTPLHTNENRKESDASISKSNFITLQTENELKEEDYSEDDIDLFGDNPLPDDASTDITEILWDNSVAEDWDDSEGYMRYRVGELMDGRYKIICALGKGVFSQVLKAEDTQTNTMVAIKVNRNNDTMKEAGETEKTFLLLLKEKQKTRNVILLIDSFEYKKHLCLVLESMEYNLRQVIQTFGGGIGITLQAVRFYTRQILMALKHMKQCNILHADIKPDNMVVSKDKRVIKVCDLGTASEIDSPGNVITPLLVSRYYRPPEIILGIKYDEQVDLWSAACCIVEMYTGKIIFTGKDNNEMLRLFMELKGKFPKKMLKRGAFSGEYFDEQGYFYCQKEEPGSKRVITQKMLINQPKIDLMQILAPNITALSDSELAEVRQLKDLLNKMFTLDPTKRIKVEDSLRHPFVVGIPQ